MTGGAGYVGSHTVVELLNNNYTVIAIDNLVNCYADKNDKPESLKRVEQITGETVSFYNVDIRDYEALDRIFKTVRVCIGIFKLKWKNEAVGNFWLNIKN